MTTATRIGDVLVVGGGTSGAALAGILARDPARAVTLLDAGPDYGPRSEGRWPDALRDARRCPDAHDWLNRNRGDDGANPGEHRVAFAHVLGGAAHGSGAALVGHRDDYDGWAAATGDLRWGWEGVAPAFRRAMDALCVATPPDGALTPWHAAFVAGMEAAGVPRSRDLNDPTETAGVAPFPAAIVDGTRWNSAFAYLDPVRGRGNLTVVPGAQADRVIVRRGRAVAVEAIVGGRRERFAAGRIVLAAGAYGTPALLLRSGIGPVEESRALGIPAVHHLPGVGRGLTSHPAVAVQVRPSLRLHDALKTFERHHWRPDIQTLARARSRECRGAYDLHLYAALSYLAASDEYAAAVVVHNVAPRSSGSVRLTATDPAAAPRIDGGPLSDPDGADLAALRDGIALAREGLAAVGWAWSEEHAPGAAAITRADVDAFVRRALGTSSPACSCRMGRAGDPLAVADATGAVYGLAGLFLCDASLFPAIPHAPTDLPAAMLAEHLAPAIGESE